MELKELAQRLQSAKEQCEDITNRLNQAKLTKEEANALLQNLAKLQTAPKQDTTDETIAPQYKSTSTATDHHTDEDEEEQTLLQKFIAYGQTNIDIQHVLKKLCHPYKQEKAKQRQIKLQHAKPRAIRKGFH